MVFLGLRHFFFGQAPEQINEQASGRLLLFSIWVPLGNLPSVGRSSCAGPRHSMSTVKSTTGCVHLSFGIAPIQASS